MSGVDALNDPLRLEELDRYDVLDTPPEEAFDRLTRMASRLFETEIATVTFVDGHRQWFKSRHNLRATQTARVESLCRVPIAEDHALVVPDAQLDERFRGSECVCSYPYLRFYAGAPIRGANGLPIGTFCLIDPSPRSFTEKELHCLEDFARLAESELELRMLATTDSLTGTLNRRAFFGEAERALALARRHRYDVSCILFDLDHFKSINDGRGHAAGDRVLASVASACRRCIRESDVFGRIGGEEFAVLAPHVGVAEGHALAEKLRLAIAERSISNGPSAPLGVTASFGVAAVGAATLDLATLLERADQSMYRAKLRGRNCTQVWQGDGADPGLARRVLKAGVISANGGAHTFECTVRRMSESGATIDVSASVGIPSRFKLNIPADTFSRLCEVKQRGGATLTVAFCAEEPTTNAA